MRHLADRKGGPYRHRRPAQRLRLLFFPFLGWWLWILVTAVLLATRRERAPAAVARAREYGAFRGLSLDEINIDGRQDTPSRKGVCPPRAHARTHARGHRPSEAAPLPSTGSSLAGPRTRLQVRAR
jgi:hypothetical protein